MKTHNGKMTGGGGEVSRLYHNSRSRHSFSERYAVRCKVISLHASPQLSFIYINARRISVL
jgi:hypothetical protein